MYSYNSAKIKRNKNPKENANLLSKIFFIFAFKTIRKGICHDFKEEDVYEIMEDYRSEKLGKNIEELWNFQLKKSDPSLMRCLIKMFGIDYMLLGLAFFTYETSTIIIQPILTGKLISYFEPNTKVTQNEATMYATGILASTLMFFLLHHTYIFLLQQICLKVKICLCALVYRKCLKLNLSSLSSHFGSGMPVTLITKDTMQFDTPLDCGHMFFNGALQLIIMTTLMYSKIGVSALVGALFLFILMPTQVYLGFKMSAYRIKTSAFTDERVKMTQEILTAIRIIKMYTWELFFSKVVNKLRTNELKNLRKLLLINAIATSIGQLSSRIAFYLCVISYIFSGNHITAENAFFITGAFSAINMIFNFYIPLGVGQLAEIKASFNRLTSFLLLEEVLSNFDNINKADLKEPRIVFDNVSVQTNENVNILNNVNLDINSGLTILTGYTGSGKSTIFKVIFGDIKTNTGIIKVSGNISYASQEPWVFPGSIKQNITFGEKFNQERYEDVIEVCALKTDFNNLPEGDQTCLIDKGLNLSRGQKSRINLARAIYREADIYLLDDCLSAVDVLVSKHVFYRCIKSYLLNKICVLVSNQTQFLNKANNVVVLSKGIVIFNGGYEKFQQWNDTSKFILNDEKTNCQIVSIRECRDEQCDNNENPVGNIKSITTNSSIYSENKERGSVKTRVYYKYFKEGGGLKMTILLVGLFIATQAASSWADYFVSFWVDMEQDSSEYSTFNRTITSDDNTNLVESRKNILVQYSLVILGAVLLKILTSFAFFIFTSKCSLNIHDLLLNNVLSAGMTFFDKNLSGNVLNRFSRDLGVIDEQIPLVMFALIDSILTLIGSLFIVTSVNIYFLAPSLIILIIVIIGRKLYLLTARSIRRLEGLTRSPVVGHLNATLEGLSTIRANKAQEILKDEFDHHQNLFNSVTYMCMSTERAFTFYLSTLGFFYILIITFSFLFMKTESSAGEIGLAITQSFTVIDFLLITIANWAEFEIEMTSTERIFEYIKTKAEDCSGSKVLNWTRCGKITYDNVNLQYSSGKPVLNNVSFIIQPRQKIGIVGRTGAGKSSVIFSLFKLYNVKGKILIDDIDINDMKSSFLRSNISIIPQDPVLFSGTVRTNLDPYGIHTDADLWNALEKVKIKSLITSLNSIITEGGVHYSIGQRQLLCLARALLRKNTILVLDEATASMDSNVDELIQTIIKTAFSNYTIITIAHRLSTIINCDKVLVMDSGEVIEYDSPLILLRQNKGMFYKMVKESVFL